MRCEASVFYYLMLHEHDLVFFDEECSVTLRARWDVNLTFRVLLLSGSMKHKLSPTTQHSDHILLLTKKIYCSRCFKFRLVIAMQFFVPNFMWK